VHGSEDGYDRHGSLWPAEPAQARGAVVSQVIKEHFSGAKKGRDLIAALREVSLSEEALAAIEEQVKRREAHIAKAPEL